MSLATEALQALPNVPGLNPTCHIATWYWAAQVAQKSGRTAAKSPTKTMHNIAAMAPAAQQAILNLANAAGTWNFGVTPSMPPPGSVLVWTGGGTHSAVVTGADQIHGYNQGVQLMHVNMANTGHTHGGRADIEPTQRVVKVIPEATIVAEAARLNL